MEEEEAEMTVDRNRVAVWRQLPGRVVRESMRGLPDEGCNNHCIFGCHMSFNADVAGLAMCAVTYVVTMDVSDVVSNKNIAEENTMSASNWVNSE